MTIVSPVVGPLVQPVQWELTLQLFVVPSHVHVAAATYGPTNGPPVPTGAAPAGLIESVLVSEIARARFRRPFPVWATVPAASAVRARRETMTPLLAVGSFARRRAAAAATSADEAEVPVTEVVSPPAGRG